MEGDFQCHRIDYEPTGGTVEFIGSATSVLNVSAGNVWNVDVDKTISRPENDLDGSPVYTGRDGYERPLTRSGEVVLMTNISFPGVLTVSDGIFDLNGHTITCSNNLNVLGTLIVGAGALIRMYSSRTLFVQNEGRLEVIGTSTELATISHYSGYYNLQVNMGGTIAAEYALFEYCGPNGVNIISGAVIDPAFSFKYCIFDHGAPSGTLLTISNSDLVVIYNPVFFGLSVSAYNVKKLVNAGQVYLINTQGDFDGEAYNNDPYNRIHWDTASTTPDFMILSAVWSPDYLPWVGDTRTLIVTVFNNSTVACETNFWLDLYFDPATPPLVGTGGEDYLLISTMPALEAVQYSFEVSNYDPGLWNSYLIIDSFNYVAEADEDNNRYGPFASNWQPLPIVPVSISRNPSTNQITLSWTYPLTVSRFNIYCDTDAYGDFSDLAGWTTGNSFSFTGAQPRFFLNVKAERDEPAPVLRAKASRE